MLWCVALPAHPSRSAVLAHPFKCVSTAFGHIASLPRLDRHASERLEWLALRIPLPWQSRTDPLLEHHGSTHHLAAPSRPSTEDPQRLGTQRVGDPLPGEAYEYDYDYEHAYNA